MAKDMETRLKWRANGIVRWGWKGNKRSQCVETRYLFGLTWGRNGWTEVFIAGWASF